MNGDGIMIKFIANSNYELDICEVDGDDGGGGSFWVSMNFLRNWNKIISQNKKRLGYAYAYVSGCANNYFEMVRFLHSLPDAHLPSVDMHSYDQWAFQACCGNGHIGMAKWIYALSETCGSKVDVHFGEEFAFRLSCRNGHLEVAKWLYETSLEDPSAGPIDVRSRGDYSFRESCKMGHEHVVRWLATLCRDYSYSINGATGGTSKDLRIEYRIRDITREFLDGNCDLLEICLFNKMRISKSSDAELDTCVICSDKEAMILTECGHAFCDTCFFKWKRRNDTCMLCRRLLNMEKTELFRTF